MAILPDFAAMLNNALSAASPRGVSYASGIRNAMVFTSLLRQRASQANQPFSLTETPEGILLPQAAGQDPGIPFPQSFQPSVTMGINPNSVRFRQPKRFTKKDTREGSVFFHFTNSQGQNNDILTLEFSGNTGNLNRRGSVLTEEERDKAAAAGTALELVEQDTGAITKLLAWHNLYLLTREPMVLVDQTENTFTITYISALFPVAIDFIGFYNQVLEFDEDARKPNSRNYRFEFTVTATDPPLDTIMDEVFAVVRNAALQPSSNGFILGVNLGPVSP